MEPIHSRLSDAVGGGLPSVTRKRDIHVQPEPEERYGGESLVAKYNLPH